MSTATLSPTLPGGARHTTSDEESTRAPDPVTCVLPNLHCNCSLENPDPTTLTLVPPLTVPLLGTRPATRGSAYTSNCWVPRANSLSTLSLTSTTDPDTPPAGDKQVTTFDDANNPTTESFPYRQTYSADSESSPEPVKDIKVPPLSGPRLGVISKTTRPVPYSYFNVMASRYMPLLLTPRLTVPCPLAGTEHETSVEEICSPRTMLLTPKWQLSPELSLKCRPATVITCPGVSAIPREGLTEITVAPFSYTKCPRSVVRSTISSVLSSRATGPVTRADGATHATIEDESLLIADAPTSVDPNRHLVGMSSGMPTPVTVTDMPPAMRPVLGHTRAIRMGSK